VHRIAQLDHRYVWHPFTQMRDWLKREPIVIVKGQGAVLKDVKGREYLDANSSIWTNLHGHNHPQINAAIRRQLTRVAHSSALGLANEPASLLAERLVQSANRRVGGAALSKVFFSDDGSTAMEVALKLAYEFARRKGNRRPKFLSLEGAYHGDTVGAVAVGHIDLFHKSYAGLLFKTDKVMAPYCYRCPHNRAKPERADARDYRKCNWECVSKVEQRLAAQKKKGSSYAGLVVEPLIQGAAGMIAQPTGWLSRVGKLLRQYDTPLIADEVLTAFGRVGVVGEGISAGGKVGKWESGKGSPAHFPTFPPAFLFACHHEGVQPDFLCLAKGLTGGYLPMAATLTRQKVFDAFLGEYEEFKTFFHGHSYTGNQLGASAALASLELLQSKRSILARQKLESNLGNALKQLWKLPNVGDIRQVGLIVGIELVRDWRSRKPFDMRERIGIRVCEAMARRGVLTRPIGNVIVLMPPYCTTAAQVKRMVHATEEAIREVI
jgi:adenosylmethionine---8-amino-7-oxononanoate aminotransferase